MKKNSVQKHKKLEKYALRYIRSYLTIDGCSLVTYYLKEAIRQRDGEPVRTRIIEEIPMV